MRASTHAASVITYYNSAIDPGAAIIDLVGLAFLALGSVWGATDLHIQIVIFATRTRKQ